MTTVALDFQKRAHRVPFLGLGLSVDVYSPNLLDLARELESRRLSIGYLEIFKANPQALQTVRAHLPDVPMAYHAEGLWFTQPDWATRYDAISRIKQVAEESALLGAYWVNQECASKEMAGFAFGTYVPPLFTRDSAVLTARQICQAQHWLDQNQAGRSVIPLMLLEVPPLTYFGIGELSYAQFFKIVSDLTPCGFVLDIGHVWTAYRYGGARKTQTLEQFIETFLEEFPLERVVQIHVAGLECHVQTQGYGEGSNGQFPPAWIDAHAAPIPGELFFLLEKVLTSPRLTCLKGLALEVDTKEISLICQELQWVQQEFGNVLFSLQNRNMTTRVRELLEEPSRISYDRGDSFLSICQNLSHHYRRYVAFITGGKSGGVPERFVISQEVQEGVSIYSKYYLPWEIVRWGGEISTMFPRSCQALEYQGINLGEFVDFWFDHPRSGQDSGYDFFVIKILRFVDFVGQVLPAHEPIVRQEAMELVEGYDLACREIVFSAKQTSKIERMV